MLEDLDALWKRYGKLTLDEVPEEVRTAACQCVLDWFGCAIYGSKDPLALMLRAELASKDDDATIIGSTDRMSTRSAALVNGSAGHADDFDDTNLTARYHATTVVLPAALAVAEARGASGADLLTAFIVGSEICSRLRIAIGEEHYREQWHQTATMGIFGAMAAVGWLIGLDGDQYRNAIGNAASQASGVHANFGTMTKPFHAGHAAECGILAANLAARGFTGNPMAFEAFSRQSAGIIDWGPVHELGGTWTVQDTLFKQYSSGAGTQATINGTKRLGITAADVIRGEVRVPPGVLDSGYGVRVPKVGLEAKFSLPGTMALTLLGIDLTDPGSFSDANMQSDAFKDLISRIELVGDETMTEWQATLVVETADGILTEPVPSNRDSGSVESRNAFLRQKFETLAKPGIGDRYKQLGDMLMDLGSVPQVSQICELTKIG